MIAYAILGHHAGLPDCSTSDTSSMWRRIESHSDVLDPIWRQEVANPIPDLGPELMALIGRGLRTERLAFDVSVATRMLFSALVDADYRDTEAFYAPYQGSKDRNWPSLAEVLPQMTAAFATYMAKFASKPDAKGINQLRSDILAHVRGKAAVSPGLFTLTVPTGGGKTLASLGFALDHARQHGHQRIIYAIPFTSIIDQTAAIFREILGEEHVLEHHLAIEDETKNDKDRASRDKLRLAMEDWAAPVVVTTNVQLFESLFAARPGRARKLHNIAGSVIILDDLDQSDRGWGGCVVPLRLAGRGGLGSDRASSGPGQPQWRDAARFGAGGGVHARRLSAARRDQGFDWRHGTDARCVRRFADARGHSKLFFGSLLAAG